MAVAKLKKTLVDKLPKGELVWDTEVVGLGVRRQTTEARITCCAIRSPNVALPNNASCPLKILNNKFIINLKNK